MGVERCRVLCAAASPLSLGGSEKGFDRLISEDDQCGYRLEARRVGLIATGLADALHDLLATELLHVIGCTGRAVLARRLFAERTDADRCS